MYRTAVASCHIYAGKNCELGEDKFEQGGKKYARQYLLSHERHPHYHRRETFSLLSSRWNQVVPVCYGRRARRLTQLLWKH